MKRITLLLFCGLMGIVLAEVAVPRQVSGTPEIPTEKLLAAMRLINTLEYSYRFENGRFAAREEMLTFLRQKGFLSKAPIDLENPQPYALEITTSPDGLHYQITLQRPSVMDDKGTWCKTAAFSDDRGVIFLGLAIDCEAAPK